MSGDGKVFRNSTKGNCAFEASGELVDMVVCTEEKRDGQVDRRNGMSVA